MPIKSSEDLLAGMGHGTFWFGSINLNFLQIIWKLNWIVSIIMPSIFFYILFSSHRGLFENSGLTIMPIEVPLRTKNCNRTKIQDSEWAEFGSSGSQWGFLFVKSPESHSPPLEPDLSTGDVLLKPSNVLFQSWIPSQHPLNEVSGASGRGCTSINNQLFPSFSSHEQIINLWLFLNQTCHRLDEGPAELDSSHRSVLCFYLSSCGSHCCKFFLLIKESESWTCCLYLTTAVAASEAHHAVVLQHSRDSAWRLRFSLNTVAAAGVLILDGKKRNFYKSERLQREFLIISSFFLPNPFDTKNMCCSCVVVSLYYLR